MKHLAQLATALGGAITGAVLAVLAVPVIGQSPVSPVPRLANGKPDLNGIWQAINEANYDIQMHVARPALAMRPGPYGPVPAAAVIALGAVGAVPPGVGVVEGGELPYRLEALAIKRENQANWLTRDPEIKCYLPGVPRATYMPYPFQIAHSASQLLIAYEYAGAVRDIFMTDPGPAPVDSWMGQSVGRWEGDTLVVDVTGFNDQTWFDRSGNFHSDALHVVERYTRTGRDVIAYEATIEDPKVFSRPWKMSMALYRRQEPNAQLMDFKCVEFVEELMFGQWRKNPLSR
ncbi:MAG TPA: hypothetical protein VFS23_22425 [Vicinamibacterales bacterium]|nr:hypothetical protein [Vicinamibacterales bacterium]